MIIPWMFGLLKISQAPVTWMLVFINFFFFVVTQDQRHWKESDRVSTAHQIELTGRLYQQYKSNEVLTGDKVELQVLGTQGLRDGEFLKAAKEFKFHGDEIEIKEWKKLIADFETTRYNRMAHNFGLVKSERQPLTWITYQFMHASWVHILSNMALLLLFGAALELLMGSYFLISTYLLSGFAGGLLFWFFGDVTIAPMIGASGSISGVMAAYAVYEKRARIPFFYFLSPLEGYFGVIYLPTLLIFPFCFVQDLASFFSTPVELGSGVAYSAHIGGMIFGICFGLMLRYLRPAKQLTQVFAEIN